MNNKYIAITFILMLISFYLGFTAGSAYVIKTVAEISKGFINKDMIEKAIYRYKEHIGCFIETENASIHINEGNQS